MTPWKKFTKSVIRKRDTYCMILIPTSVVDPKLFFSYQDPTFQKILDPCPDAYPITDPKVFS